MNQELSMQMKQIKILENKFFNQKQNPLIKAKLSPVIDKIQEIIPDKLKSTLETTFYKGFQLIFEKGDVFIEKTYNKDKILLNYDLNNYAVDKKICSSFIKKLDRPSLYSNALNSSITVIEGGVLGMIGFGIPDIPIFISVIMKTVYEIALSYGYDYNTTEEKAYILLLISCALTKGEQQKELNKTIDDLADKLEHQIAPEINLEDYMTLASNALSESLLTAKFIQGIPIVGAVGGLTNFNTLHKVSRYSKLKYKKRYLLKKLGR